MTIYSGFSHWKWWFSIAMLNYQRVYHEKLASRKRMRKGHMIYDISIHKWHKTSLRSPSADVLVASRWNAAQPCSALWHQAATPETKDGQTPALKSYHATWPSSATNWPSGCLKKRMATFTGLLHASATSFAFEVVPSGQLQSSIHFLEMSQHLLFSQECLHGKL